MEYTFQSDEDAARRKNWIVASAIVLSFAIGAILLLSAGGRRSAAAQDHGNEPETRQQPAPAKPSGDAGKPSAAESQSAPAKPAPPAKPSTPDRPTDADKPVAAPARPAKPVPASASPEVRKLVEAGQEAEMRDDLAAARTAYEKALSSPDVGDARGLVESRLGDVMVKLVSSQREMPEKVEHAIVSGDRISTLAKRHGTTVDLISTANRISNPNNIKLGDRLRILDKPNFEIEVSKSENWLLLKMNGKFFKRYTVGTGLYNRTPVGTFKVSDKIKEPAWWKDNVQIPYGDPRNILGTRWMAISATGTTPPAKGYGIHGTWDNSSLGQQSSAGCVRMANADVEELFTIIPEGTPVTIHE